MNKYIFFWILGLLFASACNKEDYDVSPSLCEIDWVDSLDMTNPKVKAYYEKYGIGLLTRFDTIRDFHYNITGLWDRFKLTKITDPVEVDSCITYLEEAFFKYFTNDDFIRKYFPRKLILAKEVYLDYTYNNSWCPVTEESDVRVGEYAVNSLHSVYSKGAFAFSLKLNTINYNEENYNAYKYDNLYIFLANVFELHDLYEEFGSDFYLSTMEKCYGRNFTGEGSAYSKKGIYVEEGGSPDDLVVDKYWYWDRGFVSTKTLNPVLTGKNEGKVRLRTENGITSLYRFPDKERDVRMLINQMFFVTREVWDSYPEVVKKRFAILMEKFDEWGIDVRALNPVMEYAFPRQ